MAGDKDRSAFLFSESSLALKRSDYLDECCNIFNSHHIP